MAKRKHGKGCTLTLVGNVFIVSFRDPRKDKKLVRRSLKTGDRQTALRYKHDLDRIISDAALWRHPHENCAAVVRQIWLGDMLDVVVSVKGGDVRVAAAPGVEKHALKYAGTFHPDEVDFPNDDEIDGWFERTLKSVKKNDKGRYSEAYTLLGRMKSLATAHKTLELEFKHVRNELAASCANAEELDRQNKVLRQRLRHYDKKAIKAEKIETLQEEFDRYMEVYEQRRITPQRVKIMRYTLDGCVQALGPDRKADDVEEAEVSKYVQTLKRPDGHALGEKRRKEIRGAVCTFMVEATKGMFDRDAVKAIPGHTVKREQRAIIWLEKAEADRLVAKMGKTGDYWHDLALIQLCMGWRPEELTILQKKHTTTKVITLEPVKDSVSGQVFGKTGGRAVQVPKAARAAVRRRLRAGDGELLFPRIIVRPAQRKRSGIMAEAWAEDYFYTQYRTRLRAAAKKARIKKPIDSRTLRRTFGSLLLRAANKRTPYEVARLLGDLESTVTRHYASLLAAEISTEL